LIIFGSVPTKQLYNKALRVISSEDYSVDYVFADDTSPHEHNLSQTSLFCLAEEGDSTQTEMGISPNMIHCI
jgi:hypothetical protein